MYISETDVAKYLILVFLIFLFAPQTLAISQTVRFAGEKIFQLNDLVVAMSEMPANDGYLLEFSRQGRSIYTGECAFRIKEPKILSDFPVPKCRSLLAYCFSGGAHCCMSLVIASDCASRQSFNVIDLAHSGGDVKYVDTGVMGIKALKVTDWQFAYYAVEGRDLELSFADSPGLTRLLVFEGARWRPDRIGEFTGFYGKLLKDAVRTASQAAGKRTDPEILAGKAITVAYYWIMSGGPADETEKELTRFLPGSWKDASEKIVRDIRHATLEFDPVQVID